MTNADMMVVFDAIMTILGVYIVFSTIKMKKEGLVPTLFVPVEGCGRFYCLSFSKRNGDRSDWNRIWNCRYL